MSLTLNGRGGINMRRSLYDGVEDLITTFKAQVNMIMDILRDVHIFSDVPEDQSSGSIEVMRSPSPGTVLGAEM